MKKIQYLITTLIVFAFVMNAYCQPTPVPCYYLGNQQVTIWNAVDNNQNNGEIPDGQYNVTIVGTQTHLKGISQTMPHTINGRMTNDKIGGLSSFSGKNPGGCNCIFESTNQQDESGVEEDATNSAGTFFQVPCWLTVNQPERTEDNNTVNLGQAKSKVPDGTYKITVENEGLVYGGEDFDPNSTVKRLALPDFYKNDASKTSKMCNCIFEGVGNDSGNQTQPSDQGTTRKFDCDYQIPNRINIWKSMFAAKPPLNGNYKIEVSAKSGSGSTTFNDVFIDNSISSVMTINGQNNFGGTNKACDCIFTPLNGTPPNTNQPTDPPTNPPSTGEPTDAGDCWYKKSGKTLEMYNIDKSNGQNKVQVYLNANDINPIACISTGSNISNNSFFRTVTNQASCLDESAGINAVATFHCKVRSCTVGCGTTSSPPTDDDEIIPLKDILSTPLEDPTCGMYIGAAGTSKYDDGDTYRAAFKTHFNLVVPEVGMKMDFLKPGGVFSPENNSLRNELGGLAGKGSSDLVTRGHTLCWHGGSRFTNSNFPDQCFNFVQDHNEQAVDCGGVCSPCHCNDGQKNSNEQAVDCGGSCLPCHCSNGQKDANEIGKDCGGPCKPCRQSSNPKYLNGKSSEELKTELTNYIGQTMREMQSRYKFESWDVVNEAFRGVDPHFHTTPRSPAYRSPFRTANAYVPNNIEAEDLDGAANGISCIWEKINYPPGQEIRFSFNEASHLVPAYIKVAFDAAAATNPNIPLIYNDWGAEVPSTHGNKAEYQLRMIKALINAGVKIDGVGFQCHFTVDNRLYNNKVKDGLINEGRISEFETNILKHIDEINAVRKSKNLAEDFKVYLTEVDIELPRTLKDNNNNPIPLDLSPYLTEQKKAYRLLAEMAASIPDVKAFITWGMYDQASWVNLDPNNPTNPLLLTKQVTNQGTIYKPKDTYSGVMNGLDAANCSSNRLNGHFANEVNSIFTAYPNPFDQTIQIDLEEGNGEMKIYDMTGRTIISQSINSNQTNINTETLKAGYYLIEVESNGETQTQKIIKH